MTDVSRISGKLSKKDLKRLTQAHRTGAVGPTTVYYAGVTAPIISAGVAVFARNLMNNASYISPYWIYFISTLIAAFAGICWYLIFMRWSYRHQHGRKGEAVSESVIRITEEALIMERDGVATHFSWPSISEMQARSGAVTLLIKNGDTVVIPNHWFSRDRAAIKEFHGHLKSRIPN